MPRPLLPPLLLALAACSSPPPPPSTLADGSPRPNILLIDIDSMRADRLLLERDGRPVAPHLQALAAQGVRFEHAVSQAGWTQPALAALLSGRYPPAIEQRRDKKLTWLPEGTPSLPTILGWYGYHTAVVWGQTLPQAFPELSKGFDEVYQEPEGEAYAPGSFLDDWLDEHAEEPFFLMIHELDLHCPRPPAPDSWIAPWAEPLPRDEEPCLHGLMRRWGPQLPAAALQPRMIAHYDGGLAFYDDVLGGTLARLEAAGKLAHTVVVLLSDHGQDLFEHGEIGHGMQWESVLRVPLVVLDPTHAAPGLVRDEVVQTVDIAPTLLALAGIPLDQQMVGRSLAPLLQPGEADWPGRPVWSLTDREAASLQDGTWKMLSRRIPPGPHSGPHGEEMRQAWVRYELFDLAADPGERHDLADEDPRRAQELRRRLAAWVQERLAQGQGASGLELGEEQRRKLQEGGYWERVRER
ncbi:MAG: sulfatase [Pseudomonadota bacterium]